MLARITWMERLVIDLPRPANQSKLHAHIQWLRTSDAHPPNWNIYAQYCRGEQRWLATHSCYEIEAKLSPIAIFEMGGRPVKHKAVFVLTSHALTLEPDRFTGPHLMTIVEASNYIGFSASHYYMLPSSNLDVHRLRSCILISSD